MHVASQLGEAQQPQTLYIKSIYLMKKAGVARARSGGLLASSLKPLRVRTLRRRGV